MRRLKRLFLLVKDRLWCWWAKVKLRRMYDKCYNIMEGRSAVFNMCGGHVVEEPRPSNVCYDCPYYVDLYRVDFVTTVTIRAQKDVQIRRCVIQRAINHIFNRKENNDASD